MAMFSLPGIAQRDPRAYKVLADSWLKVFLLSEHEKYYRKFMEETDGENIPVDKSHINLVELGKALVYDNKYVKMHFDEGFTDISVEFTDYEYLNQAFSAISDAERILNWMALEDTVNV